jgi:hypothetical protein
MSFKILSSKTLSEEIGSRCRDDGNAQPLSKRPWRKIKPGVSGLEVPKDARPKDHQLVGWQISMRRRPRNALMRPANSVSAPSAPPSLTTVMIARAPLPVLEAFGVEEFAAEGYTHVSCHCPRCRVTRMRAMSLASQNLDGAHSRCTRPATPLC